MFLKESITIPILVDSVFRDPWSQLTRQNLLRSSDPLLRYIFLSIVLFFLLAFFRQKNLKFLEIGMGRKLVWNGNSSWRRRKWSLCLYPFWIIPELSFLSLTWLSLSLKIRSIPNVWILVRFVKILDFPGFLVRYWLSHSFLSLWWNPCVLSG